VLGPTGRNFAAGMSGGVAYVFDPQNTFAALVNYDMVQLEDLDDDDRAGLLAIVTKHRDLTGSTVAGAIVDDWDAAVGDFRKVMPQDYKRVLAVIKQSQADGLDEGATSARVMAKVLEGVS
jgi:glutamate synthase (NADPH) large chain